MRLKVKAEDVLKHKTPCLVAGLFKGEKIPPLLRAIDKKLNGTLSSIIREKDFTGKAGQIRNIYTHKKLPSERVMLVGLGNKKEFSPEALRRAAGTAAKAAKACGVKSFSTLLCSQTPKGRRKVSERDAAAAVAEGTLLALYEFTPYKTENLKKARHVKEAVILVEKESTEVKKGVADGTKLCEAVCHARDMINHPGNRATPSFLADESKALGKLANVKCTVLNRSMMEKLGMGALLAVARGSAEPPKFIILEYRGGKKGGKPVVIVGKGLTFDSGGISLKPPLKMDEMKFDMSGGATAIAVVEAVAKLKLKINLVALVPSTENMPGGRANKPGDILKSMSGKTIEVINTDAEGRLILADALAYAARFNPAEVIDLATLTGACIVALGYHITAILGNDQKLIEGIKKAGESTGERVWELPLWKEYDDQIKSSIADVKNTGGRAAGTITAAAFLKKFASTYNWAHLDIAGTAWEYKGTPYVPKGAVGVGVRLLVEYLRNYKLQIKN